MLINIIGNIASGKSTLAKRLKKEIPQYTVVEIDRYRKKYNQSRTELGEELAWQRLIKRIRRGDDIILEQTGAGQSYERSLAAYPGQVFTILVDRTPLQCLKAYRKRIKEGYRMPPLAFSRDIAIGIVSIDNLIQVLDYDLKYTGDFDMLISLLIPVQPTHS